MLNLIDILEMNIRFKILFRSNAFKGIDSFPQTQNF